MKPKLFERMTGNSITDPTLDQKAYLREVKQKMENFRRAYFDVLYVRGRDYNYELDLNDILIQDFPEGINCSFDDVDIPLWCESASKSIDDLLNT